MSTTPLTLLRDTDAAVAWLRAHGATGLATDSRRVRPGDAFIACHGVEEGRVPEGPNSGSGRPANMSPCNAPWTK